MALAKQATRVERQNSTDVQERRTERLPSVSLILGVLSCIGVMVSIGLIFLYAPVDAVQGLPQKIFYFHVPMAWIGMLAFVVLAVAGVIYLIRPDERWDWLARSSAEVGVVFLTLALILGSIWGKVIWGIWWTWDAMLTAALILWFMFVAYLMLRSYMGRTDASARSAAVLGIVGVIDVPIIYEATNWWRTLHPAHEVATGALPASVTLTLMVALVTFTIFYVFLVMQLYQLQKIQTLAQRLRVSVE